LRWRATTGTIWLLVGSPKNCRALFPEVLTQWAWSEAWKFAFQKHFEMILMLSVRSLDFGNHQLLTVSSPSLTLIDIFPLYFVIFTPLHVRNPRTQSVNLKVED
jgi:hypothetical protein